MKNAFKAVREKQLQNARYTPAYWDPVPTEELFAAGLADRQVILYLRIVARSNRNKETYKGHELARGQTRFVIREYARSAGVSDRTVRRDLEILQAKGFIHCGGRQGSAVPIDVIHPKFIPAISRSQARKTPHLSDWYLFEVIGKMCGLIPEHSRIAPHLAPHFKTGKDLEHYVLKKTQLDALAASLVREELNTENTLRGDAERKRPAAGSHDLLGACAPMLASLAEKGAAETAALAASETDCLPASPSALGEGVSASQIESVALESPVKANTGTAGQGGGLSSIDGSNVISMLKAVAKYGDHGAEPEASTGRDPSSSVDIIYSKAPCHDSHSPLNSYLNNSPAPADGPGRREWLDFLNRVPPKTTSGGRKLKDHQKLNRLHRCLFRKIFRRPELRDVVFARIMRMHAPLELGWKKQQPPGQDRKMTSAQRKAAMPNTRDYDNRLIAARLFFKLRYSKIQNAYIEMAAYEDRPFLEVLKMVWEFEERIEEEGGCTLEKFLTEDRKN